MTGLVRGIRTEDGRLLSRESEITFEGIPVNQLCKLELVVVPDDHPENDNGHEGKERAA